MKIGNRKYRKDADFLDWNDPTVCPPKRKCKKMDKRAASKFRRKVGKKAIQEGGE